MDRRKLIAITATTLVVGLPLVAIAIGSLIFVPEHHPIGQIVTALMVVYSIVMRYGNAAKHVGACSGSGMVR